MVDYNHVQKSIVLIKLNYLNLLSVFDLNIHQNSILLIELNHLKNLTVFD